jgi:hypothetical protein
MPGGTSLVLENVPTAAGQRDVLAMNSDASQIRLTPGVDKAFNLTLTRMVGDQARALAIQGLGAGPAADLDVTVSPELSLLRVGNRAAARNVEVRAFAINKTTNTPANRKLASISLPTNHDLAVAVADWATLDVTAQAVAFE